MPMPMCDPTRAVVPVTTGIKLFQHVSSFTTVGSQRRQEVDKQNVIVIRGGANLTHLENEEMRVVCFRCKRAHGGSEVVHIVLPVSRHCRTQCIGGKSKRPARSKHTAPYLVRARRAYGMPNSIRKRIKRLRANLGRVFFVFFRREDVKRQLRPTNGDRDGEEHTD